MNAEYLLKYQRQIQLPQFGIAAQQKLVEAKVLVIGVGGLGCPALQYLAAAGIGTLGIMDDDTVAMHNLPRQILFTAHDIGKKKADVAEKTLKQIQPELNVIKMAERMHNQNALSVISNYDLVIDGTDNFATRYLINDACVLLNKPLIYGSVYQFEGQVAVFNVADSNGIHSNYRDLFPIPPNEDEVPGCNDNGAIGVVTGMVGIFQASEAIKLITGIGKSLANEIQTFNVLTNQFYTIQISTSNKQKSGPQNRAELEATDYVSFCGGLQLKNEILVSDLENLMKGNTIIVDIREPHEIPEFNAYPVFKIPQQFLLEKIDSLPPSDNIILICQTGKRSRTILPLLQQKFQHVSCYSLQGGIDGWMKSKHTHDRKEA